MDLNDIPPKVNESTVHLTQDLTRIMSYIPICFRIGLRSILERLTRMGMGESSGPWKHFVFQFILESGYASCMFRHAILTCTGMGN